MDKASFYHPKELNKTCSTTKNIRRSLFLPDKIINKINKAVMKVAVKLNIAYHFRIASETSWNTNYNETNLKSTFSVWLQISESENSVHFLYVWIKLCLHSLEIHFVSEYWVIAACLQCFNQLRKFSYICKTFFRLLFKKCLKYFFLELLFNFKCLTNNMDLANCSVLIAHSISGSDRPNLNFKDAFWITFFSNIKNPAKAGYLC